MRFRVHSEDCPRLRSPTRKQVLLLVDSGSAGTGKPVSAQPRQQQDLCCCRLQALLFGCWCQHRAGVWWMSVQKQSARYDGGLAGLLSLCKCRQSGCRTLSIVSWARCVNRDLALQRAGTPGAHLPPQSCMDQLLQDRPTFRTLANTWVPTTTTFMGWVMLRHDATG